VTWGMKVCLKKLQSMHGLPGDDIHMTLPSLVFTHALPACDRQTDRQTHHLCLCCTLAQLSRIEIYVKHKIM